MYHDYIYLLKTFIYFLFILHVERLHKPLYQPSWFSSLREVRDNQSISYYSFWSYIKHHTFTFLIDNTKCLVASIFTIWDLRRVLIDLLCVPQQICSSLGIEMKEDAWFSEVFIHKWLFNVVEFWSDSIKISDKALRGIEPLCAIYNIAHHNVQSLNKLFTWFL